MRGEGMKEMLRRAARTFLQAAIGYVTANVAVTASGIANGRESLRNTLITLGTAAIACGIAAVMNLPDKNGNEVSDREDRDDG